MHLLPLILFAVVVICYKKIENRCWPVCFAFLFIQIRTLSWPEIN